MMTPPIIGEPVRELYRKTKKRSSRANNFNETTNTASQSPVTIHVTEKLPELTVPSLHFLDNNQDQYKDPSST